MNQWLNRSHPPTLQAAVFLGYLSAFFGLLVGTVGFRWLPGYVVLPVLIGLGIGAFVTANNRRWGYGLLAICAMVVAVGYVSNLVYGILDRDPLANILATLNASVFPTALAAAVLHTQSREYQQIWFE